MHATTYVVMFDLGTLHNNKWLVNRHKVTKADKTNMQTAAGQYRSIFEMKY